MHSRSRNPFYGTFIMFYASTSKSISVKFNQKSLKSKCLKNVSLFDIPTLHHGLERVLFSPCVHTLYDKRSGVFNFDPYLKNIYQPDKIDYDRLSKFIPAHEDLSLINLAKESGAKFVSSTSSISGPLSNIYFLLSKNKPLNLTHFVSQMFSDEPQTFTAVNRNPISLLIKRHQSIISVSADKSYDDPTILSQLGQSMEKFLTCSKLEFSTILKGSDNSKNTNSCINSYVFSQVHHRLN